MSPKSNFMKIHAVEAEPNTCGQTNGITLRTDMTKLVDSFREYSHPSKRVAVGVGVGVRKEKWCTLVIDCITYCNNQLRSPSPVS
jgi:hypothetical protein